MIPKDLSLPWREDHQTVENTNQFTAILQLDKNSSKEEILSQHTG